MTSRKFLCIAVVCFCIAGSALDKKKSDSETCSLGSHQQWLNSALIDIQSVKPGMSRADLLRVMQPEGGFSGIPRHTFVYHKLPYIKVDVTFGPQVKVEDRIQETPSDKIVSISRPYLGLAVFD